jgi:predicted GIY-YIG superfamily endonuclease
MPYYVYLLASRKHGTLYLGVTNDLVRRIYEHKSRATGGFTTKYGVNRLVWFEVHQDVTAAITREKGDQEMATRVETKSHRARKSGLARSLGKHHALTLLSFRGAA